MDRLGLLSDDVSQIADLALPMREMPQDKLHIRYNGSMHDVSAIGDTIRSRDLQLRGLGASWNARSGICYEPRRSGAAHNAFDNHESRILVSGPQDVSRPTEAQVRFYTRSLGL